MLLPNFCGEFETVPNGNLLCSCGRALRPSSRIRFCESLALIKDAFSVAKQPRNSTHFTLQVKISKAMEPNQLEQVELSELVEQQVPMTASTLARAATIPRKPNATRTDTMDSIKSTMTTRYSLSVTRGVAAVEPTLPRAKKEGEQEPELPGPMPTDEEMKQLPRIADSLPASAWLVVIGA